LLQIQDSLISYFHQKEIKNKKRAFLDKEENIVMMELLHCLMDHFSEPIHLFQKDTLNSVSIVTGLRKCWVTFGEYLYNLDRETLKTPVYHQVEQLLLLNDKSQPKPCSERTPKQFEEYFLKENWSFREKIAKKSEEFKAEFFKAAQQFMKTAFEQLKTRFPSVNSTLMSADCILLRNQKDLETLRHLAIQFSTLFTNDEARELEMDLKHIKNEEKFLEELHQATHENVMEIWIKSRTHFPKLFKLIQAIQVFPYSTAQVEREFSILGAIKTPRRSRLSIESVEASLIIKHEDYLKIEEMFGRELLKKYKGSEYQKTATTESKIHNPGQDLEVNNQADNLLTMTIEDDPSYKFDLTATKRARDNQTEFVAESLKRFRQLHKVLEDMLAESKMDIEPQKEIPSNIKQ